ncbi:MAG: hypothetical protein E6K21_19325 [Gammaproteobacteria bacterium]|nr:MAG: hypothetical protein E6K21_19325 [Gammaproteobacteria bacterium]
MSREAASPTFYLRPNRVLIVAVEVNDVIFPEILKIAAHDVEQYNMPIAMYQACSLDVFQKDVKMAKVNLLRNHGFGLITVDDSDDAVIQFRAPPHAQHIPPERFDAGIAVLNQRLKIKFRGAYSTYQTNVVQGLQEGAQVIEALVNCIATQAQGAGIVPASTSKKDAADIIDILYATPMFHPYRAALGGARSFFREYRNPPSHPPRTPNEAAVTLRKCKAGLFEALRMAAELRRVIQLVGYRVSIQ